MTNDPQRDLLFPRPIFHEKIWGGRRLEEAFGYEIPDGPIGECWAIAAHPAGDCLIEDGVWKGQRLSELWRDHCELFGSISGDRFPLLVKILDAEWDLSIQVHPDDAYAAEHEHGSLGKCECWYVLYAKPGATIIVGQRAQSRAEFAQMVERGDWKDLLVEVPIKAGDFFQINPGTLHAIKAGTMVIETQQSSDITYRVYDYDRVQADGTKRELHLKQSMDVVDYAAKPLSSGDVTNPEIDGVTHLVDCPRYSVDRIRVRDAKTLPEQWPFLCATVIKGAGSASGHEVRKGSNFIVPSGHGDLVLQGDMTLVVSHVPN